MTVPFEIGRTNMAIEVIGLLALCGILAIFGHASYIVYHAPNFSVSLIQQFLIIGCILIIAFMEILGVGIISQN